MRLIDADVLMQEIAKVRRNLQMIDNTQSADKMLCGLRMIEKKVEEAPTIEPKQGKWISCNERLPEWNTRVLFYLEKECYYDYPEPQYVTDWWIQEGCFNDKYGAYVYDSPDIGKGISKDCVVAWMPLPKPYGERKESE